MCKIWIILLFCIALYVCRCDGSSWLQDPPSRSAAWYYQIKTPVNYNFRNLDCGGEPVKIDQDGTRNCGLCGDPFNDPKPRDNELNGKYANPAVRTRYYESGQVAEISIWNNLPGAPGFYEFRLCDEAGNQTQSCLDKYLLTIRDTGTTFMPVPKIQGLVMIHLELPPGVKCDFCLLQWRFRKESLAGCDVKNWCGVGRGAQIEYYNCADIMIGEKGQPKPSFIQDPIYTASDYGSAYDVATTRTTPDGSGLVGSSTTTQGTTTTDVPIVTIPTAFPTGTTTNNPATTTTVGTTSNPITINTPGTTIAATIGPVPTNSRLVVDSNGNAIAGQSVNGGSSKADNKYLLVLLSLIPLLGAVGLQNSRSVGVVPALPVPPSAPVTWARALPLYPLQIENAYGFGNFIAGTPAFAGTGGYGSKYVKGTYGSNSGYNTGYSMSNAGGIPHTNFALSSGKFNSLSTNSGLVGRLPGNLYNTKTYPNNNGGTQFVQNPVVWKNNGITVNNGLTRHVFPRSVSFQNGASYQPSPNLYAKPSGIVKSPPPRNEYGSNPQPGYSPHSNQVVPQNPRPQVRAEIKWPRNTAQRVNSWQNSGTGQGNRNWINTVQTVRNNNWQTNGGLGAVNRVNVNGVGTGQRIPVPETVIPRMRLVSPDVTQSDSSFGLPGIESASRFQVNSPRQVTETSQPMGIGFGNSNGGMIQNGNGRLNGATLRSTDTRNNVANNFDPRSFRTGKFFVNDWYNMLLRRLPVNPPRPL